MEKHHFLKMACIISIFAFFAWFVSCAVNPVTGKKELMLVSQSQEIQWGEQGDKDILRTYGSYNDKNLSAYLDSLGQKLVSVSHRSQLKFYFRVLGTPVVNAFAIPGGYVYLTRGILAYLNNEAELAAVMGHEIGHVAARHSAKQYSKAQVAQLGLGLASAFSEDFRKYAGLAQFGAGLLFLKFSRDDERQADALGVAYASKAGYNALEMADFFVTLDRLNPSSETGGLPDWFSTHPNSKNRIKVVRKIALEWQQKLGKRRWKIDRSAYLQKLNGLVYGQDPRQGFVEKGVFYHPQLQFYFPIPQNWKLTNTPSQVQMVSPKKDAAIIFTLANSKTPAAAAEKYIGDTKGKVISSDAMRLYGYPAYRVVVDFVSDDTNTRMMAFFIQKAQQVYSFYGMTTLALYNRYQKVFESTMYHFNKMKNPLRLNVKPDRIRIRKVTRTATVRKALLLLGVPAGELIKTALLNGRSLGDTIQANTLLKIVVKK